MDRRGCELFADRRVIVCLAWCCEVRGVGEVGSGLNGERPMLARILSDPSATVVVVAHRDRLARFGTQHLAAVLAAQGSRIVVVDDAETTDDLVCDVIDVLTSMCAWPHVRRGARNRAPQVVTATQAVRSGQGGEVGR